MLRRDGDVFLFGTAMAESSFKNRDAESQNRAHPWRACQF
jgi:hypothetical protein